MRFHRLLGAVVATAAAAGALTSAAQAAPSTTSTVNQINRALTAQSAQSARAISSFSVPGSGSQALSLSGTTLSLPATGAPRQAANTVLYSSSQSTDAQIAVQQPNRHALRALVSIDGPSAPERFPFSLGGDVASLAAQPDGSIQASNARGTVVGYVEAPWARDANGREVPTHYEISGTTITQVVLHRGAGFTYGITADPSFIKVLKCAGAIAYAIASGVLVGAKLLKIKKLLKALGGVKNAVKLVLGATTKGEKIVGVSNAVKELGALLLSVPLIKKACF